MNQDTLIVQRGECLSAELDYNNEDGTAMDITLYELAIPEASEQSLIDNTVLTITNALKGTATIYVPAATMNLLPSGRASWFRLALTPISGGCSNISMKLWVDIQ